MRMSRKSNRFKKTINYDVITIKHGRSKVRLMFSKNLNTKWTRQRTERFATVAKSFYGEDKVTCEFDVVTIPNRPCLEKDKAHIIYMQLILFTGETHEN